MRSIVGHKSRLVSLIWRAVQPYWTDAGRDAASHLAWLVIYSLSAQACSLIGVLIMARGLNVESFGGLMYALTVQSYLLLIGSAGVKTVVLRESKVHEDLHDTVLTSHLLITLTASATAFFLTTIFVTFVAGGVGDRFVISLLALGNVAVCVNIRPFFDSHHRQPLSAIIICLTEVGGLIVILLLFSFNRLNLPMLSIVFVGKWTLGTIAHYLAYNYTIRPIRLSYSSRNIRRIASSSWPLLLAGILTTIPMSTGIFFVRYWHGVADSAMIGFAQQIAGGYVMLALLGNRIVEPHIAGTFGLHASFARKLAVFAVCYLALILLGSMTLAYAVLTWLLPSLYGQAVVPTCLMLVGAMSVGAGMILRMYLIVLAREIWVFGAYGLGATVAVIGSACAAPRFSSTGVATTMMLGCIVATLAMFVGVLANRSRFYIEDALREHEKSKRIGAAGTLAAERDGILQVNSGANVKHD